MLRHFPQGTGWLEVVCGSMYSGKSEEMIRRLRREQIAGKRVIVFKPAIDTREVEQVVVSRAGGTIEAIAVGEAGDIRAEMATAAAERRLPETIGIDEVQFFDEAIVPVVLELAEAGVRVICAGLDMDFRREPFGPMPELLARADFVDKVQAVCHRCGGPATLTQRLIDGKPAPFSGDTIQVGDLDAYEARCRRCFEPGL